MQLRGEPEWYESPCTAPDHTQVRVMLIASRIQ